MRVILLAPQVPWPPRQGTAIRNFHIAMQLAARHDVTLLAFGERTSAPDPLSAVGVRFVTVPPPPPRSFARRLADIFVTLTPDLARRLDAIKMDAALAATLHDPGRPEGFDIVQVEGLEMARYGLAAVGGAPRRPRLVYDAHNAEWVLQHRAWQTDIGRVRLWHGALYSIAQTLKLRRFERRLLAAADATVAVSERDAEALRQVCPRAPITVVPNGVDLDYYRPADPIAVDPARCVFTGKMDFRPNIDAMVWFATTVWPRVRAACPDARLAIVGRDPAPRVRALAAPDIVVTGAVHDVRPHLVHAGVVVVPLRVGGGTRLKVLEAMAMSKAIAATTLAVEGLHVADGQEVLLADTPEALANAVLRLIGDPTLRANLGARGRARVEAEYQWSALVPAIEALYGAGDVG